MLRESNIRGGYLAQDCAFCPFIGEFKTRFSEALEAVRKGESITVTFGRKKKAVAIVSPIPTKGTKRPLGLLAGKARIAIANDWEINESQFLGT